jgi:hypothetical protein
MSDEDQYIPKGHHIVEGVDGSTFVKNETEPYSCSKCGKSPDGLPWYHLSLNNSNHQFCSRACLVEFIAPELKKAVVVNQWVPTPEEERRMSEEST